MGLKSKPEKITVNENTQSIDGSKTIWNEENRVKYLHEEEHFF